MTAPRPRTIARLLLGAAVLAAAGTPAPAIDYHWQGAGTGGNTATDPADPTTQLTVPTNWIENGVPYPTDNAYLPLANAGAVYAGTTFVRRLDVDGSTMDAALYIGAGDHLYTTLFADVGYYGMGRLVQTDGLLTTGDELNVGYHPGAYGQYEMSGGTINAGTLAIGRYTTGSFIQSGGTHNVSVEVLFGYETGGNGSYTLSGGTLSSTGNEYLGYDLRGEGHFVQTGGSHLCGGSLNLSWRSDTSGTYEISAGNLEVGATMRVGYAYYGTFAQHGGSVLAKSVLRIGSYGTGSYTLTDGELTVLGTLVVGPEGTASFLQSGGTVRAENGIEISSVSNGHATYTMTGGDLIVGTAVDPKELSLGVYTQYGRFTQTGGSNTIHGTLIVDRNSGGSSTYTLSGNSTLTVDQIQVGAGGGNGRFEWLSGQLNAGEIINSAGGTVVLGGSVSLDTAFGGSLLAATSTGAVEVCNGATVTQSTGAATWAAIRPGGAPGGGTYQIDGPATLTAGEMIVGRQSDGTLSIQGGAVTINGTAIVAEAAGVAGRIEISGGSLMTPSPGTPMDVYLGYNGPATIEQTGGTFQAGENQQDPVYLGYNSTASCTYRLSGGTFTATAQEYLGYYGDAAFEQSGGTHNASVRMAANAISTASYSLSGGTLTGGQLNIGYKGAATVTQTGGLMSPSSVHMGEYDGASGSYTLSGTGVLNTGEMRIGVYGGGRFRWLGGTIERATILMSSGGCIELGVDVNVADFAAGAMFSGGGSVDLSDGCLDLGHGMTATHDHGDIFIDRLNVANDIGPATYNLSAGTLDGTYMFVGDNALGVINHTGGRNHQSYDLILGVGTTGVAEYNFSGGTLSVKTLRIGAGAAATFTLSGTASANLSFDLDVGSGAEASGVFLIQGGSMAAGNSFTKDYHVYIGNNGTGLVQQSAGSLLAQHNLYLGYGAGSQGTYELSGGTLTTEELIVSYYGSGTFTQTGGTNTAGEHVYLAYRPGTQCLYTLGGTGVLDARELHVGLNGDGGLLQTSGTCIVQSAMYVGQDPGSLGTYELREGRLDVVSSVGSGVLACVGYRSTGGLLKQTGGTVRVGAVAEGTLYIGYDQAGAGSYELGGGGLGVAGVEYVGYSGTGSFVQTGGSHQVSGSAAGLGHLYLGYYGTARGTYQMSGSSALSAYLEHVGHSGVGQFTQDGGVHAADTLVLGANFGANGTYTMNGGNLIVNTVYVGDAGSGTFVQNGGTHISQQLHIADKFGSLGTYTLAGGHHQVTTLHLAGEVGATGTYIVRGGRLTIQDLWIGTGFGFGEFRIENPAAQVEVTHEIVLGAFGKLIAPPGTVFQVSGNSFLNQATDEGMFAGLANVTLRFDAVGHVTPLEVAGADLGRTTSPLAGNFSFAGLDLDAGIVRLVDAFDNGNRHSPECQYVSTLAIGDDALLDLNGLTLYVGTWDRSAGNNGLVVESGGRLLPAYAGDTNFDAQVNIFDAFSLNAAWGAHLGDANYNPWTDFDGNGSIDIFDAFILNQNWGRTFASAAAAGPAAQDAAVPEPATAALLGIGTGFFVLAGGRRRNRRGKR